MLRNKLLVVLVVFSALAGSVSANEIALRSQGYDRSEAGFRAMGDRVMAMHGRNLLTRPQVRFFLDGRSAQGRLRELVDGDVGRCGAEGRVFLDGQPTVLTYYLGEPKTITELGVFSGNVDARGNQDFEIRVADNSRAPGVLPDFSKSPVFTTGPVVIGQNGGGFHTSFAREDGQPLVSHTIDWVEFRIWRTYNLKAGEPAHSVNSTGATVCLEFEVLGTKNDVVLPSPAELARRKQLREAPRQPERIEKDTWKETLVGNFEALFAWEQLHDRLTLADVGVELGPWFTLGPMAEKSELVGQIRTLKQIDLSGEYQTSDGSTLRWQKHEEWADGNVLEAANVGKGQVVFICRDAHFNQTLDRDELCLTVMADRGVGTVLPEQQRFAVRSPFGVSASPWEAHLAAGPRQILLELQGRDDGPCRLFFMPQAGIGSNQAGDCNRRASMRERVVAEANRVFATSAEAMQINWEVRDEIWCKPGSRRAFVWLPGYADEYLRSHYRAGLQHRLARLKAACDQREGIRAEVLADRRNDVVAWVDKAAAEIPSLKSAATLCTAYYRACAVDDLIEMTSRCRSMQLSVNDQQSTFAERDLRMEACLEEVDTLRQEIDTAWDALWAGDPLELAGLRQLAASFEERSRTLLTKNPVLQFDRILVAEGGAHFASNWGGPNRIGTRIVAISPTDRGVEPVVIHEGPVSSMDLHWDAERLLFSDGRIIYEINVDGTGLRQITPDDGLSRYDPCYLPDGNILFVSNACWQAVPCTGGPNVGNLHLIHSDGTGERRVTFDQDHDWNPTVMHDGRVLYSRWEYADTPHYFTRLLFRMNPDGSGQMEYYGSNSYWPNATYWPRPIPGHPTMISCIVSGHHGVSRSGEFLLLDPARGRHEAAGAVQKIPGYGCRVEPTMKDQLVTDIWPKYAAPYPLAEPQTNRGAGKYFLVCRQENAWSDWQLCLADIFDNVIPLADGRYMAPIPLRKRPMPPVIPSLLKPEKKEALVYLSDIYQGPGLKGFPRGTIKKLRIGTYHYRYFGNGDTRASSLEGGWDVKRILGTVPVNDDGSALFRVPANTPLFVQPVDSQGKAQQLMRSWFTAMPGETLSCVGCHEKQNSVPPSQYTTAANGQMPSEIQPWYGPARGFSFEREIQPLLDRRCAGCHNGQPCGAGGGKVLAVDLRAKQLLNGLAESDPSAPKTRESTTDYSPAYIALQRYVRRPGFESDYHMPKPAEYEADTSVLVQMLKKGHYSVELTAEEWERLYTWIDFNVPYPACWAESHRPPTPDLVEARRRYKATYAGIDDRDEMPLPLPPVGTFETPQKPPAPPSPMVLEGWPLTGEQAAARQQAAGAVRREIQLTEGVNMTFMLIPAGKFVMGSTEGAANEWPQATVSVERPFYMGSREVTNAHFAPFHESHDSGVINERWKDRSRRGTEINQPDAPVVRVTWQQAMAFCEWLSGRTGLRCTLPTEAQWEWACRAGTATDFHVGDYAGGMAPFANIADEGLAGWNHGRAEPGYRDGLNFSVPGGRFTANAWGLFDMHGNVAEWCRTSYRAYPYQAGDGRNDLDPNDAKVVRGGSWNDTLENATSAARWRYDSYKPVYNVGFRVVIEGEAAKLAGSP